MLGRIALAPGGFGPAVAIDLGPGEERDPNGEQACFFQVRGFEPGDLTVPRGSLGEFVPLPAGWYRVSTDVSDAACEPWEPRVGNCERHELFTFLEVGPPVAADPNCCLLDSPTVRRA